MKRLALVAIRFYQRSVSPGLAPACRFEPTCSHYAYEAIETRGVARGTAKALWRLLRCNPLNVGGYDPVTSAARTHTGKKVSRETCFANEHAAGATPHTPQPEIPGDGSPA